MTKKVQKLLEELGYSAAKPTGVEHREGKSLKVSFGNSKVFSPEVHQQAEEVEAPIIESYTQEDLEQLFETLELDTKKYTFEYLAEQLGFEVLNELKVSDFYKGLVGAGMIAAGSTGANVSNNLMTAPLKPNIEVMRQEKEDEFDNNLKFILQYEEDRLRDAAIAASKERNPFLRAHGAEVMSMIDNSGPDKFILRDRPEKFFGIKAPLSKKNITNFTIDQIKNNTSKNQPGILSSHNPYIPHYNSKPVINKISPTVYSDYIERGINRQINSDPTIKTAKQNAAALSAIPGVLGAAVGGLGGKALGKGLGLEKFSESYSLKEMPSLKGLESLRRR
jgi:hypothetical protein